MSDPLRNHSTDSLLSITSPFHPLVLPQDIQIPVTTSHHFLLSSHSSQVVFFSPRKKTQAQSGEIERRTTAVKSGRNQSKVCEMMDLVGEKRGKDSID